MLISHAHDDHADGNDKFLQSVKSKVGSSIIIMSLKMQSSLVVNTCK